MFVTSMTENFSNDTVVSKTVDEAVESVMTTLDATESIVEDKYEVSVDADTNSATLTADTSEGKIVIVFIGDKANENVRKAFSQIIKAQTGQFGDD